MMSHKKFLLVIVISIIAAYLCGQFNLIDHILNLDKSPIKTSLTINQSPNFVLLVKQVGSSVVSLDVELPQLKPSNDSINQLLGNDSLNKNYPLNKTRHVYGSGFIISEDGYIVTSSHVIQNALTVKVKTINKLELNARIIGVDNNSDIALLKVNAHNLPIVRIGDPNQLEVGQWVAAIGGQFGFDNSVTHGIISAKNRKLLNKPNSFIQTDVPINPGSSGSPLFNLSGEVVGVNSQIYSRIGGYMGISFAIPINLVMQIVKTMQDHLSVIELNQYGLELSNLAPELLQDESLGVIITCVKADSDADRAGLMVGDKLIAINGKKITKVEQVKAEISSVAQFVLEVNRGGQKLFITIMPK